MGNQFFEHPILNSPYEYPAQYWELDEHGQPTQKVIESRRRAEFITPIPKPRKRKQSSRQQELVFDEGKGLSTQEQQYDPTPIINAIRQQVDRWRAWPRPDVVVLDLRMPGMDGFEVCRRIKAREDTLKTTVIAITAYPSTTVEQRILECGAEVCLTKPLEVGALLKHITTALAGWPRTVTRKEWQERTGVQAVAGKAPTL